MSLARTLAKLKARKRKQDARKAKLAKKAAMKAEIKKLRNALKK